MTNIQSQLAEQRAIQDRNAQSERTILDLVQELEGSAEGFAMIVLDTQRGASDALARFEGLTPEEIDELDPQNLVGIITSIARMTICLTDHVIRRTTREQAFLQSIRAATEGRLALGELQAQIQAGQERLVKLAQSKITANSQGP